MKVLVWLIPIMPAVAVLLNGLLGRRLLRDKAHYLGVGSVGLALLFALIVIFRVIADPQHPIEAKLYPWIFAGTFSVDMGLMVDSLSAVMLFVVCGVGFLVHVYSIGYMHGDPSYPRFFTYLNLFMTSMLVLVLADNYLLMFVGWEGVGLCSYLLIGFWYERRSASDAGKKAFIVNRIGDAGFILAMALIFWTTGSLAYHDVFAAAGDNKVTTGIATAITLLLFVGAMGKSAQIPLYVWLPDAMEGPTPVSALIHAATMVVAGVLPGGSRTRPPTFEAAPDFAWTWLVAIVGLATTLLDGDALRPCRHGPETDSGLLHGEPPGVDDALGWGLSGRITAGHIPPDGPRVLQGACCSSGREA